MKTKNLSILFFILVFAGVVLLGYTQVQAQINLGDGICSAEGLDQNLCIRDCDYVIEVITCADGTWPCTETINGVTYKVFPYRAQIAADATLPCNCDTWSYTVTQFEICEGATSVDYVTGSDPSGSALFISNCKISKCEDATAPNPDWGDCNVGYETWKLNPTLNCSEGGSVDFEIRTPVDAGVSCGNPTWIRDKSGCTEGDNLLRGPGCGELLRIATQITMDGGAVTVNVDPCTADVTNVEFAGYEAQEGIGWFCWGGNPDNGGDPTKCGFIEQMGPYAEGCFFRGSCAYSYAGRVMQCTGTR